MPPCVGKIRYGRRSAAKKYMHSIPILPRDGVRASVYRCKACGYYHIGHDFRSGMSRLLAWLEDMFLPGHGYD
jgi:hypothetical protein